MADSVATISTGAQGELARLVRDLKITDGLCRVEDYSSVTLNELQGYLDEADPLVSPVCGEVAVFSVDEGYYIPRRMLPHADAIVATTILVHLGK